MRFVWQLTRVICYQKIGGAIKYIYFVSSLLSSKRITQSNKGADESPSIHSFGSVELKHDAELEDCNGSVLFPLVKVSPEAGLFTNHFILFGKYTHFLQRTNFSQL
jgi:hypothetical protein